MPRITRGYGTVMVVEDDPWLAGTLKAFLADRARVVYLAATKREAEQRLRSGPVDLALVDLALPDGSGLDLLELVWNLPAMPGVVVITGSASPETAFRLAQMGVRAFLTKPVRLDRLERVCRQVLEQPPDLRPFVRASVGHVDLRELEASVRTTMTDEALAVAGRSRRRASGLLGISRQLLQHILRERADQP